MSEKFLEEKNYKSMSLVEMLAKIKEVDIQNLYLEIEEEHQEEFNKYDSEKKQKLALIYQKIKEDNLFSLKYKMGQGELRALSAILINLIPNNPYIKDIGEKINKLYKAENS